MYWEYIYLRGDKLRMQNDELLGTSKHVLEHLISAIEGLLLLKTQCDSIYFKGYVSALLEICLFQMSLINKLKDALADG